MSIFEIILIVIVCIAIFITTIYLVRHVDDVAQDMNELENIELCEKNPKFKKAFLKQHDKMIEQEDLNKKEDLNKRGNSKRKK